MPSFDNSHSLNSIRRLSRRASLTAKKLNRTVSLPRRSLTSNPALQSPRLPSEILDHVIELALAESHIFSVVASFALASSDFRQIAFRRFFRIVRVKTNIAWNDIYRVLESIHARTSCREVTPYLWVR